MLRNNLPDKKMWQWLAVWAAKHGHELLMHTFLPMCGFDQHISQQTRFQISCGQKIFDAVFFLLRTQKDVGQRMIGFLLNQHTNISYPRTAFCTFDAWMAHDGWDDLQQMRSYTDLLTLAGPLRVEDATYLFQKMIGTQIGPKQSHQNTTRASLACKLDFLARHNVDPLLSYADVLAAHSPTHTYYEGLKHSTVWTSSIINEPMSVMLSLLNACVEPPTLQQCARLCVRAHTQDDIDPEFLLALEARGINIHDIFSAHFDLLLTCKTPSSVMEKMKQTLPTLYDATISARRIADTQRQRLALQHAVDNQAFLVTPAPKNPSGRIVERRRKI